MPNAADPSIDIGKPKFLLVGPTGSGKTSQIATLPGKTFAYLFDPSALATLRGQDIEYEEFFPTMLNLGAVSLSKGKSDPKTATDAPDVFTTWEKDFESRCIVDKETKKCYWDTIDNIAFDSFTTFSDVVMDRILKLNGRVGQFPQQDDWGGQMQTITNVVRTLTAMRKNLIFTAHDEFKQDETTSRMQNVIILTGRLRIKIPLLFSDIWHMESASTAAEIKYQAQTRPDRMNPAIRCTFRELAMFEDMTVKDWNNPQEYGIGKILNTRN